MPFTALVLTDDIISKHFISAKIVCCEFKSGGIGFATAVNICIPNLLAVFTALNVPTAHAVQICTYKIPNGAKIFNFVFFFGKFVHVSWNLFCFSSSNKYLK